MTLAVASKLASVEWDFKNSPTKNGLHSIHPYPAKFIPLIPRHLIELFYTRKGTRILDPFCGSGTTLVESINAGINCVGVDLHPLAALLSKVKTTSLTENISESGKTVVSNARRKIEENKVAVPEIPKVDHWFQAHIQTALAALISEINAVGNTDSRDALRIAFSSIVVRVSNQDSDTRYAAVQKNVAQQDVWNYFEKAVKNIGSAIAEVSARRPDDAEANVVIKDLMLVKPEEIGGNIGLVITSPPYPNAYEYWLYHKYRMYWLGMDPLKVREKEIGSRSHYFKKNHQTEKDFEEQMGKCFSLLSEVMIPDGFACFVVGRSIIHGRHIDNELLLERAAAQHGFRKAGAITRNIALNRKSFNLSHGKINKEGIIIFQKDCA